MIFEALLVPAGHDHEIQFNDDWWMFGANPLFVWIDDTSRWGIGLASPRDMIEVAHRLVFDPTLFNTLVGDDSGYSLTTGVRNTLGAYHAGYWLEAANDNTGWGYKVIGGANDGTASGDYTQYVVGITKAGNVIAAMVTTENVIVTSWGTNGYFTYYSTEGSDGPVQTRYMHQLSDGRILLATDEFRMDAPNGDPACYMAHLIMLNADGTLDTTWGHNGFFGFLQTAAPYTNVNTVLEDADGNFHIFCQVASPGGGYYKLTSAGVFVSGLSATNYSVLYAFQGACWADDAKTRIIAVGQSCQLLKLGVGYFWANVSAIDPATGTRDNTWTGNIGITGAAKYGAEAPTLLPLYTINRMSDDGFVTYENAGSPSYLHKFIADGSAYDTDWATNGKLQIGVYNINMTPANVIQDGDTIYMYSLNDLSKVRINNINGATGVVTSYFDTTVGAGGYVSMTKINDNLFCGLTNTPLLDVERWTTAPAYVDGIDVGSSSVWWIIPDEETREAASYDVHRTTAFGSLAFSNVYSGADDGLAYGYKAGESVTTHAKGVFIGAYAGCHQTT